MNLKKMILIFSLFFLGIFAVEARSAESIENSYCAFDKAYRLIGAVTYYYDYSAVFTGETNNKNVLANAVNQYNLGSKCDNAKITETEVSTLSNYFITNKSLTTTDMQTPFANQLADYIKGNITGNLVELNEYINDIAKLNNLDLIFQYARTFLKNMDADYHNLCVDDNTCSHSSYIDYENTIENTKQVFSTFCDYLNNHKGISYYLATALKLISYIALTLAVILGALDFIKAITSNDDAALNKAFQTFVKRLVAVALIFLSYVIVQLIVGLVGSLPNTKAEYFNICEDLKIGGLKGFEND